MAFPVDHLPPDVARCLRSFYRRRRFGEFLRLVLWALVLYLALALVAMHLDRFLFLTVAARVLLWRIVHGVVAAFILVGLVRFLLRRPSVRRIAYELESRLSPDVAERFVTLDSVLDAEPPADENAVRADLLRQLETDTIARSRSLHAGRLNRDRRLRLAAGFLAVAGLVCAVLAIPRDYQFPLMAARFMFPRRDLPKPSFIRIKVISASPVIGRGGEAVIQAEIAGSVPRVFRWLLDRLGADPARCLIDVREGLRRPFDLDPVRAAPMSRIQRRLFLFTRADLRESFSYRIRCGDAETRLHAVEVVAQPRVVALSLLVKPPAYSGLPEAEIPVGAGPLALLPRSEVTVRFRVDQPVKERRILVDKKKSVEPEWDPATRTGTWDLTLTRPTSLEIRVVNARGFANVGRAAVTIGLREDQPPTVRLEQPPAETEKVPGELVPFQARIEDDLGIAEVALRYQVNPTLNPDAPFKELPIAPEKKPGKSLALNTSFDLGKTGAIPGDEILVLVRARDSAGNDGLSRPALIRVVAFTRGENERRRLVALRFVRDALLEIARNPAAGKDASSGLAIDSATYARIKGRAAAAAITLPDAASLSSILDLLEREQHFTDLPRNKADLRMLYVATLDVPPDAAARAVTLKRIADDLMPGLIHYRALKNITWRLFGMRYEADRIAARFKALDAAEKPGAEESEALKRRTRLYLSTLQDLGAELIALARDSAALDVKAILGLQGDLNTAAYYLGRGSFKRRMASCEQVSANLDALLALLPPALPRLLERERAARAALEAAHADMLRRVAAGPPEGADPRPWRERTARALQADRRMIGRNAFAPFWPRFVLFALAADDLPDDVRAWLVRPDEATAARIRAAARGCARLAADWQRAELRALAEASTTRAISPAERALADRLIRLESPDAPLPQTAEQNAIDAVKRRVALPPPDRRVAQLVSDLDAAETRLDALAAAIKSSDPKALAGALPATRDALARNAAALAGTIDALSIRLRYMDAPARNPLRDEVLYLKLRAAQGRYLTTAGAGGLADADGVPAEGLDASRLSRLSLELALLRSARAALKSALDKILAEYRAGEYAKLDAAQPFAILRSYARSARLVALASGLSAAREPAAVARRFLAEFPEAGVDYLAGKSDALAGAAADLAACEQALRVKTFPADAYAQSLASARRRFAEFRDASERAGAGDAAAELRRRAEEVLGRCDALAIGAKPDAVVLRKRLFVLGDVVKDLGALRRRLAAAAEAPADAETGFRGGPDGIWAPEFRRDAEVARRRVLAQARYARAQVTQGLLEALKPKPDRARFDEAVAWSLFNFRLVRSELAGPVRLRPRARAGGEKADRFVEWLVKELDESRKVARRPNALRHYARITREYLDSAGDFLRY